MPHELYINGDDGGVSEGSEDEAENVEDELSLIDSGAPARALAALNALRKSRQHYDVVLVAAGGEEPAHRAVLAAASPYLLRTLTASSSAEPSSYRLPDVPLDALRPLLEYAYTGKLSVRDTSHALALYRAAWRLRFEQPRQHLAERLVRRLEPASCLAVRALPDLPANHLASLDAFIAQRFDDVCRSGALGALPEIKIEMMRETSADGGEEAALVVAEAALAWLQTQPDENFELLCSRTHLVYVDSHGALRDCGELPAASGDAPELQQYRKEAAARRKPQVVVPHAELPGLELGGREAKGPAGVLAARAARAGGARALLAVRGRLAAARVTWSDMAGGGSKKGGALGGTDASGGERRTPLALARAALGGVALKDRLLVCGGYDRSRVHSACELYDPNTNVWSSAADLRVPRARFPAARLDHTVYAIGGSDGHAELDSVEAWTEEKPGGAWKKVAKLPLGVSHAAAAVDEDGGTLYVIGGWASGSHLRKVLKYSPKEDTWVETAGLKGARAQAGAAVWKQAVWALGGCDAWHCLASTEKLALGGGEGGAAWESGPALPTARRSVGVTVWRGFLVSAGGSDGAASLRRTEWLHEPTDSWKSGPQLRKPRAALALAVLQDTLYAAGGFDGKEFLACVECLYHPDGEWTELRDPPAVLVSPSVSSPTASISSNNGPNENSALNKDIRSTALHSPSNVKELRDQSSNLISPSDVGKLTSCLKELRDHRAALSSSNDGVKKELRDHKTLLSSSNDGKQEDTSLNRTA